MSAFGHEIDGPAAVAAGPERVLGMHWYNPSCPASCVEVVRGEATDPAVLDRTVAAPADWDKAPAVTAGFVGNRIQFAMVAEAFRCPDDGITSAPDIDLVVLDHVTARLGDRFTPPGNPAEAGQLWGKAGSGVHGWASQAAAAVRAGRDARLRARLPDPAPDDT